MKCHLQSMAGTLLGTCCKMSATINKCVVPYLEMLGTYPIAGIQVLKCHKHDLQQVSGWNNTESVVALC